MDYLKKQKKYKYKFINSLINSEYDNLYLYFNKYLEHLDNSNEIIQEGGLNTNKLKNAESYNKQMLLSLYDYDIIKNIYENSNFNTNYNLEEFGSKIINSLYNNNEIFSKINKSNKTKYYNKNILIGGTIKDDLQKTNIDQNKFNNFLNSKNVDEKINIYIEILNDNELNYLKEFLKEYIKINIQDKIKKQLESTTIKPETKKSDSKPDSETKKSDSETKKSDSETKKKSDSETKKSDSETKKSDSETKKLIYEEPKKPSLSESDFNRLYTIEPPNFSIDLNIPIQMPIPKPLSYTFDKSNVIIIGDEENNQK